MIKVIIQLSLFNTETVGNFAPLQGVGRLGQENPFF